MAFERFVLGSRSTPRASVFKPGLLYLNRAACDRYGLRRYSHAVLYWDAETGRIGLDPTTEARQPGARRLLVRPGRRLEISIEGFLRRFGIGLPESMSCPVTVDQETGYLVVELRGGRRAARRDRKAVALPMEA